MHMVVSYIFDMFALRFFYYVFCGVFFTTIIKLLSN